MENNQSSHKITDQELVILFDKKLSLLGELFQLVQKQEPIADLAGNKLDSILDQKDQCIESLQKTDEVIAIWHEHYSRQYNEHETLLLNKVETGLNEIWEAEQKLEQRLQKEKNILSQEMEKLKNHSKLHSYLKSKKNVGQNLNFRR